MQRQRVLVIEREVAAFFERQRVRAKHAQCVRAPDAINNTGNGVDIDRVGLMAG